MRRPVLAIALVALALLVPGVAMAQSAIAGVVKDTSGAVLPGVTVEASSPVLIEKVKTATSNEAGQYRVVDLRPGTYTVTFTLSGFSTVVREGIVLEANFTAPVNVDLRVGNVTETITVTGETPIVDVQTSQRREVVPRVLLETVPTGRNFVLMAGMLPSVTTGAFDVGGSSTMSSGGSLLVHGSLAGDSRNLIDGIMADGMFAAGQCSCVYDNEAQTQEMVVQVSGGSAENQLSGVVVNRIPRTGGNSFSGDTLFTFSNTSTQSSNLDDDLRARNLTSAGRLYRQYDINYSLGGPIVKDRLWFFASGRNWAYNNYVENAFNPDGSQAQDENALKAFPARLTAQVTTKNRVTWLFDRAFKYQPHNGLAANVTPAAALQVDPPGERLTQGKWTSTVTNHLLFEAGYNYTYHGARYQYEPEVIVGTCHVAFALCPQGTSYGSLAHQDTLTTVRSVAPSASAANGSGPQHSPSVSNVAQASMSYVSGAHAFKAGFQQRWGWKTDTRQGVNGDLVQLYRSGVPFAVSVLNTPVASEVDVNSDLGVFVQDTWTTKRLTLSPGLRWDHFNASIPAQTVAAGRFVPQRNFDAIPDFPNWNNVTPRFGASYDLSGRGTTAVKGNVGLYVQGQGTGFGETYNPMITSTDQRTWTDLNRDDIAQENEIGAPSNTTFGVRRNTNPDPNIKRPYQLVWDVGVQHEVVRGVGVSVSYNQRSFYNIFWTDNLALSPSDYSLVTIPDPRSSGQTLPVYNIAPAKFGLVNELDSNSHDNTRLFRSVDVSFNLRLPGGGSVNGGTSTGRTITSTCQVEDPNSLRFCDQTQYDVPFQTLFKLAGSYPLPYGFRLSGTFQGIPASERIITYAVTRALVPTLSQTSVNVRLNEPGSSYNDRVNQLDLSLAKSFRSRGVDVRPELALFNLLNTNPVLTQTNVYGPALGNVTSVLKPRVLRLGLTMKF